MREAGDAVDCCRLMIMGTTAHFFYICTVNAIDMRTNKFLALSTCNVSYDDHSVLIFIEKNYFWWVSRVINIQYWELGICGIYKFLIHDLKLQLDYIYDSVKAIKYIKTNIKNWTKQTVHIPQWLFWWMEYDRSSKTAYLICK